MSIDELEKENEEEFPVAIKLYRGHARNLYTEVRRRLAALDWASKKHEAEYPNEFPLIQLNILQHETQLKNILVGIEVAIKAAEERSAYSGIDPEKVVLDLWGTTEELKWEVEAARAFFEASVTQLASLSGQVDFFKSTNPFGLPDTLEVFHFDQMMEIAKENGYAGQEQNLSKLLNKHRAEEWEPKDSLCFDRTEFTEFLEKRVPKWRRKKKVKEK